LGLTDPALQTRDALPVQGGYWSEKPARSRLHVSDTAEACGLLSAAATMAVSMKRDLST
jgi:hypothetical protein